MTTTEVRDSDTINIDDFEQEVSTLLVNFRDALDDGIDNEGEEILRAEVQSDLVALGEKLVAYGEENAS